MHTNCLLLGLHNHVNKNCTVDVGSIIQKFHGRQLFCEEIRKLPGIKRKLFVDGEKSLDSGTFRDIFEGHCGTETKESEEKRKRYYREVRVRARMCICIYVYYAYITARTGQSITSLLNLTDLMAGRNGAAARKKRHN